MNKVSTHAPTDKFSPSIEAQSKVAHDCTVRKIIKIDKEKCNGCGLCVSACHEGAIGMVDSKAQLLRDDYCDGLGDCLPVCPTGAITFEQRPALAYNKAAVEKQKGNLPCGCPGTNVKTFKTSQADIYADNAKTSEDEKRAPTQNITSQLGQWPVQIKLVPVNAPYFDRADLLISADCAAYAYGDFHNRFMRDKITLIGCPKLDTGDYSEKLTAILKENDIKSVTVVRMEVPCCGGIENAVKIALENSRKTIPLQIVTVAMDRSIKEV